MLTEVWASLSPEGVQDPGWYYQVGDPVVLPELALCGHPVSPIFSETHCAKMVKSKGWQEFGPEWPSVLRHPEQKLLLSEYVGDLRWQAPLKIWHGDGPCCEESSA